MNFALYWTDDATQGWQPVGWYGSHPDALAAAVALGHCTSDRVHMINAGEDDWPTAIIWPRLKAIVIGNQDLIGELEESLAEEDSLDATADLFATSLAHFHAQLPRRTAR